MARAEGEEQAAIVGASPEATAVAYAGFWRRLAAYLVDSLLLMAAQFLVGVLVYIAVTGGSGTPGPEVAEAGERAAGMATMAVAALSLVYWPVLEAGPWQATLGKLLLGLQVMEAGGGRLGLPRAFARHLARLLCGLTLGIGYLAIVWTRRKQGLHDLVAGTVVVRRKDI